MLGIGPRANLVCCNAVELQLHQAQMHFSQLPKSNRSFVQSGSGPPAHTLASIRKRPRGDRVRVI
jgi:hypothetical protein